MTAPEIGNVGVNAADTEAVDGAPAASRASSCATSSPVASSWRAEQTLDAYLAAARHRRHHRASTRASSPATSATRARRTAPSAPTPAEALLAARARSRPT